MAVILSSVNTNNGSSNGGNSLTTKQLESLIAHYETKCLDHIQQASEGQKLGPN